MLFEQTDQKTKEVFCVWSQGEVIDVKRFSVLKKNETIVMVKWDEQFVESELFIPFDHHNSFILL